MGSACTHPNVVHTCESVGAEYGAAHCPNCKVDDWPVYRNLDSDAWTKVDPKQCEHHLKPHKTITLVQGVPSDEESKDTPICDNEEASNMQDDVSDGAFADIECGACWTKWRAEKKRGSWIPVDCNHSHGFDIDMRSHRTERERSGSSILIGALYGSTFNEHEFDTVYVADGACKRCGQVFVLRGDYRTEAQCRGTGSVIVITGWRIMNP